MSKQPLMITGRICRAHHRALKLKSQTGVNSMSLDKNDIEKIAHLARITLSDEDVPGYAESLSSILKLVEQMDAVNTDDVEPMAHPHAAFQRLREDVVTEENQREHFQQITPNVEDGLYLVPKVLD